MAGAWSSGARTLRLVAAQDGGEGPRDEVVRDGGGRGGARRVQRSRGGRVGQVAAVQDDFPTLQSAVGASGGRRGAAGVVHDKRKRGNQSQSGAPLQRQQSQPQNRGGRAASSAQPRHRAGRGGQRQRQGQLQQRQGGGRAQLPPGVIRAQPGSQREAKQRRRLERERRRVLSAAPEASLEAFLQPAAKRGKRDKQGKRSASGGKGSSGGGRGHAQTLQALQRSQDKAEVSRRRRVKKRDPKTGKIVTRKKKKRMTRLKKSVLESRLEQHVREDVVLKAVARACWIAEHSGGEALGDGWLKQRGIRDLAAVDVGIKAQMRSAKLRPPAYVRRAMRRNRSQLSKFKAQTLTELQHPPFAPYVRQEVTRELKQDVVALLERLTALQRRDKERNPMRARMNQRIVSGMREVRNALQAEECAIVIFATDLESSGGPAGVDAHLQQLFDLADEKGVPVAFALSRNKLGKALKRGKCSVVGVLDSNGAHETFVKVRDEVARGRAVFDLFQQDALYHGPTPECSPVVSDDEEEEVEEEEVEEEEVEEEEVEDEEEDDDDAPAPALTKFSRAAPFVPSSKPVLNVDAPEWKPGQS